MNTENTREKMTRLDTILDELAFLYEKHLNDNPYSEYHGGTDIDHLYPAKFFEFCVGIPYGTISSNYTVNSKYSYFKIERYLLYVRDELVDKRPIEDVARILFEDNKELFPELYEAYSVAISTKNFACFCFGITSGLNANDISWFLGASMDSRFTLYRYLNQLSFGLINSVSLMNSAKHQEDYQYDKYKNCKSIVRASNDRLVIQWFPSPKTCDIIAKIYSDLDSESEIAKWFYAMGRL